MERALISGKLICEEKDRTPSIGGGTVFFGGSDPPQARSRANFTNLIPTSLADNVKHEF